jgi:Uma2 family endonuclease
MSMAVQERLYTAADLWELSHSPEYDEQRLELSEGVLIVMALASIQHGDFTMGIGYSVKHHADLHDLGVVTAAETGFILHTNPDGKDTVRAPDVGFISKARIPEEGLPEGYFQGAPDLAVEVVSPNDSADEIQQKVNEYLQYGAKAVWVFYPKSKTIAAHTPKGTQTLRPGDSLEGGDVLPGFKLAVSDLFSK